MEVPKSKFKPKSLEYLRWVQETGKPIIITEHGKPVLKLVPYAAPADEHTAALRSSVLSYDEPLEPVALEDWETLP